MSNESVGHYPVTKRRFSVEVSTINKLLEEKRFGSLLLNSPGFLLSIFAVGTAALYETLDLLEDTSESALKKIFSATEKPPRK
ncbi:hypothetical protein KBD75_01820 [Candidatus Woesebacteria bacterium]|nr:hypothetical protein [Candidatus Woesebacteria bacterium]